MNRSHRACTTNGLYKGEEGRDRQGPVRYLPEASATTNKTQPYNKQMKSTKNIIGTWGGGVALKRAVAKVLLFKLKYHVQVHASKFY